MANFGTYEKPFAAISIWYSKPVNPVLGTFEIPPVYRGLPYVQNNKYFPDFGPGPFSVTVFKAASTDGPMTVKKLVYQNGTSRMILEKDANLYVEQVTIKRWPANAIGASGSDGHCDIVDETAGVIHSFWGLTKNAQGEFSCVQYDWAPLLGSGIGDGAHPSIGARATGFTTCAGIIRKHEIADGKALYEHALACTLSKTALSGVIGYVSPATRSDHDYQYNTGQIPEGALLMLPADYDTSRLNAWPNAKKIAETLKVYGARVTDRNTDCPIGIIVENGSNWVMHPAGGWDTNLANELEVIRSKLRQVITQEKFINGLGQTYAPLARQNLLSMRGPWKVNVTNEEVNLFNSLKQRLDLPAAYGTWNNAGGGFTVTEFKPVAGNYYKLYVESDCSAQFQMNIRDYPTTGGVFERVTPMLGNYQSIYIKWPRGGWYTSKVSKPTTAKPGYLLTRFIEIPESEYLANTPKLV